MKNPQQLHIAETFGHYLTNLILDGRIDASAWYRLNAEHVCNYVAMLWCMEVYHAVYQGVAVNTDLVLSLLAHRLAAALAYLYMQER